MARARLRNGILKYFEGKSDHFDDADFDGIYVGDDKLRRPAPLPVPPGWIEGPSGWHSIVCLTVLDVRCTSFGGVTGKVEVADDYGATAIVYAEDWRGVQVYVRPRTKLSSPTAMQGPGSDTWYVPFAHEMRPSLERIRLPGSPREFGPPPILIVKSKT
jgi:hypothetical protein